MLHAANSRDAYPHKGYPAYVKCARIVRIKFYNDNVNGPRAEPLETGINQEYG